MNENSLFRRREAVFYDIVALLDNSGAVVVKYRYDAWGNCITTVVDPNASTIAELNPFRYRSYYFDTETGFYFLKTRYYDPEIGRFMTIDDIGYLDPESINGLNLYAYCSNNPTIYADHSGRAALSIGLLLLIGFGVGALIGAGSSAIGQFVGNGFTFEGFNWGQFILDTVLGGISGMLSMSTLGTVPMII